MLTTIGVEVWVEPVITAMVRVVISADLVVHWADNNRITAPQNGVKKYTALACVEHSVYGGRDSSPC